MLPEDDRDTTKSNKYKKSVKFRCVVPIQRESDTLIKMIYFPTAGRVIM